MRTPPAVAPMVERVRVTEARLADLIAGLDDHQAAGASHLPGWSRGHLLTHLARNADSHTRRCRAAKRGEFVEQYVGGPAGRAAEIEAGASRRADELRHDVVTSSAVMMVAFEAIEESDLEVLSRDATGTLRQVAELPTRRWQEVEIHLVDLDLGLTTADWSDEFVETFLPPLRTALPTRLPDAGVSLDLGSLSPRDELAWHYGRLQVDGLPILTGNF